MSQGSAKSTNYPSLYDTLMSLKSEIMKELRVCMPGQVTVVNVDRTVNVQPSLMNMDAAGAADAYPELQHLPVFVLQGNGVGISLPPAVGDNCLIVFSDRCIASWKLNSGSPAPLPDLRKHSINDGFVLVGVNPTHPLITAPVAGEAGLIATAAGVATAKVATKTGKITIANQAQNLKLILDAFFTAVASEGAVIPISAAAASTAKTAIDALLY